MKRTISAVAVLLCAFAGVGVCVERETDQDTRLIVQRALARLRSGPGPIFPVKAVAKRGTAVVPSATEPAGRWIQVASLGAVKDVKMSVVNTFEEDKRPWVAARCFSSEALGMPKPVGAASADEVKVTAASVAACIRGFDDEVIAYLQKRNTDKALLERILAAPFTPAEYDKFKAHRLAGKRFSEVEFPYSAPEDFVDAVTMDRLAAMVGTELAKRLGGKLCEDKEKQAYVAMLGTMLGEASPCYDVRYRFVLIDAETPNTFCAPGGIVVVTSAVFRLCKDESELAALLAHEVGHSVLQHAELTRKTVAKALRIDVHGLWNDLNQQTGGVPDNKKAAEKELNDLAEWFLSVTLMKPRRLKEEREADAMSLALLARCRYRPAALISVIQRLHENRKPLPWEARELRNHPTTKERIADLKKEFKKYRRIEGESRREEFKQWTSGGEPAKGK